MIELVRIQWGIRVVCWNLRRHEHRVALRGIRNDCRLDGVRQLRVASRARRVGSLLDVFLGEGEAP